MPISKNGRPIATLDDWATQAAPERDDQWVDGRAAKETARAWVDGGADLPKEVATLLKRNEGFGPLLSWTAEPRVALPYDTFVEEAHHSDLVVEATDALGDYMIVVDGTVDEPFGDPVGDVLSAAVDDGADSDGLTRVEQLVAALFGPRQEGEPALKDLRYRLLTACGGALCEAERRLHRRVLLVIHEFVTDRAQDKKLLVNTIDLGRFVKRLSHGMAKSLDAGSIVGPFVVPGMPLLSTDIDFYLGKVSRDLRSRRG